LRALASVADDALDLTLLDPFVEPGLDGMALQFINSLSTTNSH
jgi:hypothetical protein